MTGRDGRSRGAERPVVVVGGSVAGLAAALVLARGGRRVVLLERDRIDSATDAETAFGLDRAGAPQAHQTHGFLARMLLLLRAHLPDVLDELLAAGAHVVPLTRELPDVREGDEDLAILVSRRTTFEWVLRAAAEREPGVEIRGGATVAGLLGEPASAGRPALVTGVALEDGSGLEASAVVLATGRRGGGPGWLDALGVDVHEVEQPTGHLYLTRWYRFSHEVDLADHPRLGGDLGYLKFLAIPGDGGTLSATLAVRTSDSELRGLLLEPPAFDAALGALEGPRALLAEAQAEAIGPVLPMAGLINRIRRFVDDDGGPTVVGLHAVGDAHTCTNPLYGRGCTLAVLQATLLADAWERAGDDAVDRSRIYEAACAREVEPWYHSSVLLDTYRPTSEGGAGAVDPLARVFTEGRNDPVIGRAFLRTFNLLWRPDEMLADAAFMARAAEIIAAPPRPLPVEGPTRSELLAVVGAEQNPA